MSLGRRRQEKALNFPENYGRPSKISWGEPTMKVRWKRKEIFAKVLIQVLPFSEKCSENSYEMCQLKTWLWISKWKRLGCMRKINWYPKASWLHVSRIFHHVGQIAKVLSFSLWRSGDSPSASSILSASLPVFQEWCFPVSRVVFMPYMTDSEWTTPFTGLILVFRILDSKGGAVDKRGMCSHTWANWREKEPDETTPVSKEISEHVPCYYRRRNFHKSKTAYVQNLDSFSCK